MIQDGRRGKVGQIVKKSSSDELPDPFRRNLVEMIDNLGSFRFDNLVTI